jgi:cellulose synthase/poly-beta-1,6-N-acetylglucosamine synthase-like glycosyltransferase
MLSGGHMLLRRSAIEAVGDLFDPAFFMYYEDADLSLRLQKSGYTLNYLPAAEVVHEWCYNSAEEELGLPSRQHYFKKNFTGSWLLSLSEKLNKAKAPLRPPESKELGICTNAPTFPVVASLEKGWLLELGANFLLVPTIFHIGQGVKCQIPNTLWQRLCKGRYWARLSDRNHRNSQLFTWNKE